MPSGEGTQTHLRVVEPSTTVEAPDPTLYGIEHLRALVEWLEARNKPPVRPELTLVEDRSDA